MYNITTLNKINQRGMTLLDQRYTVNGDQPEEGILVRSARMHGYDFPDSLLAISRAGAGYNNIPVESCSQKGIVVFNTPGANANGVKELVIAGLLLSSRNILDGVDWAKTLRGQDDAGKQIESGKSAYAGPEIEGKTLGIIGLGAIGVLVANAASALGMQVYGYDPYISVDSAWGIHSDVTKAYSIDELCAQSDYLSVHVPLMEATQNMINSTTLAMMKRGVRILNFARDGLVDDDAMAIALETGQVACYVTDFPNSKTMEMKNAINIPHLGASTPEAEVNCSIMAVLQLKKYLERGSIKNSVNFPDCEAGPCTGTERITVLHRNIPAMVSQITSAFSKHQINISDMINKSKKEWAYTVLDIEGNSNEDILRELSAIQDVVRVRVIADCC